jgi:hypothetical protein
MCTPDVELYAEFADTGGSEPGECDGNGRAMRVVTDFHAMEGIALSAWRRCILPRMSLEKISQIISNAFKTATAVNSGTPDEKHALDALGGLSGLVEARARQGAHLNAPANPASASAQKLKSFASIPTSAAPQSTSKAPTAAAQEDSYDLK